ncbi:MAG TPA: hypothetical protein VG146_01775 [Verrucomicrobiae bacterium]|nr:hypothetical protein [Verrucomicrobiae bacterium]
MANSPQAAPVGAGGVAFPQSPPPVPWDPEELKPICEQLIPALEEGMALQVSSRAEKARLPGEIVQEIQDSAKWPTVGKRGLEISAPRVAAKLLNATGISPEYKDVAVLVSSLALIGGHHVKLLRRLDKLIALQNLQPPPKQEPQKEKEK